jgi:imidazolonepropionase-like amidohydrolase
VINSKSEDYALSREIYKRNLTTLANHRVRLVIGSDYYEGTVLAEVFLLGHQPLLGPGIEPLGAFDNLILLKMWTEATPRAIFPGRKIGRLGDGYEASFLVLKGNPLDDFVNVRHITMKFKQGSQLPTP